MGNAIYYGNTCSSKYKNIESVKRYNFVCDCLTMHVNTVHHFSFAIDITPSEAPRCIYFTDCDVKPPCFEINAHVYV